MRPDGAAGGRSRLARRGHDEPHRLRTPPARDGDDAGARPGPGRHLQHRPDAEGHLPVAQPAGPVRHPQLRRDGPQADRGADHQPVRAVLPVRQQRGARRVAVDPEHGDAQAVLPAGDRHGRGDGPDGRLLQPGPVDHARRVAAAVRGPARRGEPAGRLPRLREQDALRRPAPGPGPVPGPADVLRPGGHLVAAPLRRQHPDDRRQRRPRPPPLLQPLAPGRRRRDRPRQLHQPVRQRGDQGPVDGRADQRDGRRPAGAAQRPAEAGGERLHPRRRHGGRRDRHPRRLRAWSTAASRSTCRWSSRPPPRP